MKFLAPFRLFHSSHKKVSLCIKLSGQRAMNKEERQLKVLFGTQTGCAKEVAERIAREGKRRHYKTQVISLDAYQFVSVF